jgi:RNA polymerase sigma-70 factor, ECF subfamily
MSGASMPLGIAGINRTRRESYCREQAGRTPRMQSAIRSMNDKRHRFDTLVLPHLDAAYRFARWLSRSPGDADDVVQEAMLRAFRGIDSLRGLAVKAWLLTIVKNCHLTALTEQQRRAFVPLPEEDNVQDGQTMIATTPDPESTSIRRDEERTVDRLLSALSEEHREVLVLREIEELDYREIASVTNLPIGTVMSRLARGRAALKARWLHETEGEPHAVR